MKNGDATSIAFLDNRHVPWAASVAVFLLACAVGFSYLNALNQEKDVTDRLALESTVDSQIEALQSILVKAQAPLHTLSDIMAVSKVEFNDFDEYASHLLKVNGNVAALFLAPGGVVDRAHPLAGNEAAMGHDLLADPARRDEVEEAVKTGRTVLAGPLNMRQGGVGLFARKPVFLEANGEKKFWGLVIALIKWETVKQAIEAEANATGCAYELRRKLGSDQDTVLIARSADEVAARGSVTRSLPVPGGEWVLTMSARQRASGLFPMAGPAAVLAASLACAFLVFLMLKSRQQIAAQSSNLLKANEELEQRLHERNLLIREVHHRVKNNLQVIISLLDLQSEGSTNKEFKSLVAACKGRVRAIALAHEQLYADGNLGTIDVKNYVEGIVTNVMTGFAGAAPSVRYSVESSGSAVVLTKAVPLGLIVTELVTNCLKHAFAGVERPEIRISVMLSGNGMSLLTVRDNGKGFPDMRCPTGALGLVLVESLASQLGGGMRCHSDGGAVVEVEFPV